MIYQRIQVQTPNWNAIPNLKQTCGGRKSTCLVWIRPTDSFQTHPKKYSVSKDTSVINWEAKHYNQQSFNENENIKTKA